MRRIRRIRYQIPVLTIYALSLFIISTSVMAKTEIVFSDADSYTQEQTKPENVIFSTDIDDSPEPDDEADVILENTYFPEEGQAYGWLWTERTNMMVPVYWGDTESVLDHGAGTCTSGVMPGCKGPVILAGHVLSFFNPLQYLQPGDRIFLETWYGTYEYEITELKVYDQFDLQDLIDEKTGRVPPSDDKGMKSRVFMLEDGTEDEPVVIFESEPQSAASRNILKPSSETKMTEENHEPTPADTARKDLKNELILYTCWPFYRTGEVKTNRYTVIARQVSGFDIAWK